MIFDSFKDDFYQKRQPSLGIVAIDSSFVEAKKGGKCRVQRIQKEKRNKIHAVVSSEGLPFSIVIGSGTEYDPYKFEEILGAVKSELDIDR